MKLLLLLAALFGGALLLAAPASAHATLDSSAPADGARLKTAPTSVTLHFDEGIGLGTFAYVHVTNSSGDRVEAGSASHPGGDSTVVGIALRPNIGDGTFTVSYRVVSADSHPVAGVVRFVVGTGPLVATPSAGGAVASGAPSLLQTSRWVSWGGFALLGGSWLLLTVWPAGRDDRRARAIGWTGWVGAVVGAVFEVVIDGPYTAGVSLDRAFDWSLLDATLHSDYGQLHSARLLLLGVCAVVLGRVLQPAREPAALDHAVWPLALGVAYTFSAAGHATTTAPAWLSIGVDMAHLLAMAAWVGGLAMVGVALLPRREPEELREVLPVFSRVAFVSVVVLAASGTYAAWRGVGSWRAFVETAYGLLVLGKIAGFVLLLALGNLSRRVIQKRMRRPVIAYAMTDDVTVDDDTDDDLDDVATERMRRSVLVEVALAGVVLVLAAVLVGQPRGAESLAAQAREPVSASASLGGGRGVDVTVDPGRHGVVTVDVELSSAARSVTATAAQPARQLGPIPVPLVASGPTVYSAGGVDLPASGTWVITLVVTSSQFDAVTTDVRITLS